MQDDSGDPAVAGTVIFYGHTTIDASGVNTVTVEVDGQGVGQFPLDAVAEVLEEPTG